MILLLFILIFGYILMILFTKRSNHKIIPLLIFSYIIGGMLNEKYSMFGRLPHELIILFTFFLVIFISFLTKKKQFITITWGDKVFFFFYITVFIIPLFANLIDFSEDIARFSIAREILPLKIWMIFRIFYFIYLTSNISEKNLFITIASSYVWSMFISGSIGVLRLLKAPFFYQFIEDTWPFVSTLKGNALRMQATVGGTNGAGILFAISAIFSLYLFFKLKENKYIYSFVILLIFLLFTASFSSIFTFLFMFFYWLWKSKVNPTKILKIGFYILILSSLILLIPNIRNQLTETLDARIQGQTVESTVIENYGNLDFVPNSFKYRIYMWEKYFKLFIEKPYFGYGYKLNKNEDHEDFDKRTGVAESYIVELLLYSGFFGLGFFLIFYNFLISRLKKITFFPDEKYILITILLGLFLSQISNVIFNYGGINELFGITILLINILYIKNQHLKLDKGTHYNNFVIKRQK